MNAASRVGVLTKLAEPNLDKHLRHGDGVTQEDRSDLHHHFGSKPGCNLGQDKDSFYVCTHRARSKSYPRRFINSTG